MGNPYAHENTRLGVAHTGRSISGGGHKGESPKTPSSPTPSGQGRLSPSALRRKLSAKKGRKVSYISDSDAPALLQKAQQVSLIRRLGECVRQCRWCHSAMMLACVCVCCL